MPSAEQKKFSGLSGSDWLFCLHTIIIYLWMIFQLNQNEWGDYYTLKESKEAKNYIDKVEKKRLLHLRLQCWVYAT